MDCLDMELSYHTGLPPEFLTLEPNELHSILEGPSLIEIKGRVEQPLFVSTLLHGNEYTGVLALQELLRSYEKSHRELPRSLLIFIGNPKAAKEGVRHLPSQADFNRIWKLGSSPEHAMAAQVLEWGRKTQPFMCIDIHNTTGKNPHYACLNQLSGKSLYLASLFSPHVVYFLQPDSVFSHAFSQICPSITVESGLSGQRAGIDHVVNFVDSCLHLNSFPHHKNFLRDLGVYHSYARIFVESDWEVLFEGTQIPKKTKSLSLISNLDELNFTEIPSQTVIGAYAGSGTPLIVRREDGEDVTSDFFQFSNQMILTDHPIVPSLITRDVSIIKSDCLGYIMKPHELIEPQSNL